MQRHFSLMFCSDLMNQNMEDKTVYMTMTYDVSLI